MTSAQFRELDQATITNEPIHSLDLMERASRKCFEWIISHVAEDRPFSIVCGTGNNGGDGLAIGRMLMDHGHPVNFWVVSLGNNASSDFQSNKDRLTEKAVTNDPGKWQEDVLPVFESGEIVIDAIFGTGLSRPAEGKPLEFIEAINNSGCEVISIDIPSGLCSDESSYKSGFKSVNATHTLTFQTYKLSFLLPITGQFTGNLHILDIGLDPARLEELECMDYVIETSDIRPMIHSRPQFSHKGNFGHALLMAGSEGMTGASVLSVGASLRSGCGLVTGHIPGSCKTPVRENCPEAMTRVDRSETNLSELPDISKYDAIGIGPGIGTSEETAGVLKYVIQETAGNLVIDADGLNILAQNPTWLAFLPPHTILTPHPGEFERLTGKWSDDFERNRMLRDLALKSNSIIILKGRYTAIADPNGMIFYSPAGNPGMAKGGSGDVLTGLITGLLARGLKPLEAAIAGVYLHGKAGDHASAKLGMESMTATDLIRFLPDAFVEVEQH